MLADPDAQAILNDVSGAGAWYVSSSTLVARFLTLYTAAPLDDSGTGGTEVPATNGYARAQIAGQVTANGAWTTASTTITLSLPAPAWLLGQGATPGAGYGVYSNPAAGFVGTIASISGSVLTLTTTAQRNSFGASDTLQISAFPLAPASSGLEPTPTPCTVTNTGQINFPQSTGSWGSVLAWAISDSPTVGAGNVRYWDYLGGFPWLPANCTAATPAVILAPRHGYPGGQPIAITGKVSAQFPTFSQSNFTNNVGTLINNAVGVDTFSATNAGTLVGTATTGDLMVRQIVVQAIPANTTPQFAAGAFTLAAA